MSKTKRMYRVIFVNQDELFELYASHVYQSDMYGFVEVEEFVFGSRSQVVVDPGEEKLKGIFSDVKRSFIPMQAIVRIDEVNKEGVSKISDAKGSISSLPLPNSPRKGE
ncbi:DUF1820 family protein [Motiliproteus sp. MSK22-1]|uniref:DUF1820 family protein n=1 Tax=Motiliproteus sp. MSK22-1 TaxID=1897630 RepID=UPI00097813C0|nr:DUF1820 family protein [Motiliproteus sp. MSK22-1]OMH33712.1 hypothetical protein BGP75_11955 [Motiliproteus sp. MSK22-1]